MSCYKIRTHEPDSMTCRVGFDAGAESFYVYVARPMVTSRGRVVGNNDGHVIEYAGLTGVRPPPASRPTRPTAGAASRR
jgi:hypothetical protein